MVREDIILQQKEDSYGGTDIYEIDTGLRQ